MPARKSTSRLKIGLVFDDSLDRSDGVQQYVLTLGKWLSDFGHEVHYLVSNTKRSDIPNIHNLGSSLSVKFNANHLQTPLPASKKSIRQLLSKEKFDVLHVQLPYSPFLAGKVIMSAPKSSAVVGTFHIFPHSRLVHYGAVALATVVRRSLRRFDEIVSVSQAAAGFAKKTFGIETAIIPNAVDIARFSDAIPFDVDTNRGVKLLFLGRLMQRKGCRALLLAINQLKTEGFDKPFHLTVCGAGPLEESLKAYVQENHLQNIVEFTGFVSEADKPRYMASADVSIFPSSGGESFGIVLVEAMASGKSAVIAGNNPGYQTVMKDVPYKVLFVPSQTRSLADMLKNLIIEPKLRQKIARAEKVIAQNYDINTVAHEILAMYRDALSRRRTVP